MLHDEVGYPAIERFVAREHLVDRDRQPVLIAAAMK
jgi:hypothetical protein